MFNPSNIEEMAYCTLMDMSTEFYELNWIEPIFVEGHPCFTSYTEAWELKEKICDRLESNDDLDCHKMFDSLLSHAYTLSIEMFRQGMKYQKMLDESITQKGHK